MKKKFCLILLACCLLSVSFGCDSGAGAELSTFPSTIVSILPETSPASKETPVVQRSERAENWSADINYLKRNYKMYHPDPFYLCSEEELSWKLDQLVMRVDDLTDDDIYFELAEIIAGMGDNHTAVLPPDSIYDQVFPVLVSYFGDRLYLYGYLEGYDEFAPYLLREIIAVNGIDIAYLKEKAARVTAPFNNWQSKELFSSLRCFNPAFFNWAGCDGQEGYTLQVINENREVESVVLPVVSLDEYMESDAVYPETWDESITFMGHVNWTEYFQEKNGGYVYLSIGPLEVLNGKLFYQDLFNKTVDLIKTHPTCGKLVIDLRANSGGAVVIVDYIREVLQPLKTLPIKQVFVITSGYTMSAGIMCLSMFKEELGAIHIGEPTGQFTSFFYHVSTPMTVNLPQSQLSFQIATGWLDSNSVFEEQFDENGRLHEWENTILPDVYVYQDIEDICQGRDSVIQWVLNQ